MQTTIQPTIKASELRIGNCVYWVDEDSTEKKIVEVGISELEVADTFLQPIPLTKEILEKCFFGDDVPIYLWKDKNGYYLLADESPLEKKPEYLHQLQNLYFALTGKELEINL